MTRTFILLFLTSAGFLLAPLGASAAPITIDTVPVGNLGNAPDPLTGNLYGSVSYDYRIGTTEVTVGQYTAFLNAVAATDTYFLYSTAMATDLTVSGIARSGVSGSFSYSVIGSANKPVTYVTWGDAVRFANWMHNNQPTGAQNLGTTEDGAYFLNGAMNSGDLNAVARSADARWFIPSESEWYKAAYHQPAAQGGDGDSYWAYPTGTNSSPFSDQPPGSDAPTQSNTANFRMNDSLVNGYNDGYAATGSNSFSNTQNYLTDAGAYASAMSPYGTFDQGGSVWEWNEALVDFQFRVARGGSWTDGQSVMAASFRLSNWSSTSTSNNFGFRVATVPEPSSLLLSTAGFVGLLLACRRRKRR